VLEHWAAQGIGPSARLAQWRTVLTKAKAGPEGLRALTQILLDEGEEARRFRDFAPFAGILSREERRKAFLTCRYDH